MIDLAKQFNSPPEMYPFFDFFRRVISSPGDFKELLQCYAQKQGYNLEYAHSAFPRDIDPAEEAVFEDSIRFLVAYGINNDHEVIVPYDLVYEYLRQFTVLYLNDHPHDETEITHLLEAVKKALLT
ncbi:MAG: hypothetical protein H9W80_12855 [Enterococcus sp.]|nr:hypothetical protein [Enterococcus sp.]